MFNEGLTDDDDTIKIDIKDALKWFPDGEVKEDNKEDYIENVKISREYKCIQYINGKNFRYFSENFNAYDSSEKFSVGHVITLTLPNDEGWNQSKMRNGDWLVELFENNYIILSEKEFEQFKSQEF